VVVTGGALLCRSAHKGQRGGLVRRLSGDSGEGNPEPKKTLLTSAKTGMSERLSRRNLVRLISGTGTSHWQIPARQKWILSEKGGQLLEKPKSREASLSAGKATRAKLLLVRARRGSHRDLNLDNKQEPIKLATWGKSGRKEFVDDGVIVEKEYCYTRR